LHATGHRLCPAIDAATSPRSPRIDRAAVQPGRTRGTVRLAQRPRADYRRRPGAERALGGLSARVPTAPGRGRLEPCRSGVGHRNEPPDTLLQGLVQPDRTVRLVPLPAGGPGRIVRSAGPE